jgi:predicted GTPase
VNVPPTPTPKPILSLPVGPAVLGLLLLIGGAAFLALRLTRRAGGAVRPVPGVDDVPLLSALVDGLPQAALVVEAASPIFVDHPSAIRGKTVLVVEDGPTLTHGGMAYGAGMVAARRFGAAKIVDPRPYAVGSIVDTYEKYPTTGNVLPAMGYGQKQVEELGQTINNAPCDMVIVGTPIDLRRVVDIHRPSQRVRYELQEIGQPTLEDVLATRFA